MSYYSRVYRQRNPRTSDEVSKEPFFSKQHDTPIATGKGAFFQTKLSVNEPGDKYEREADAVANAVVKHSPGAAGLQQKLSEPEKEKKEINKKSMPRNADEKKKKVKPVQKKSDGTGSDVSPQLSSQIEHSSGKGTPLPAKSKNEMSSSFGVDFENVKVHNDTEAVRMNQLLQSQAFTHGNDIYFNRGKFNPETSDGKFLLAHELTHVVQQGASVKKKQIQRSFWGTVGGAIAGAVGGFFVGGPVGAVVGGIAGAGVGDAVTTDTRKLNENERKEAAKVFGNSLNYDMVSVSDSSKLMQIGGYARTPGNTVYFPTGTLGRSDPAYYAFLIHELTHTWQSQHGVAVLTKIRYSLSSSNYDFGGDAGLQKAINDGKCFNDFNTEAQASIMERYYEIRTGQRSGDLSLYEWFVFEVKYMAGKCSTGATGIKTDILDSKYRPGSEDPSFA